MAAINIVRSVRHGRPSGPNPWDAPSLEWSTASPPPAYNFAVIPIVASRYPLWEDRLEGASGQSSTRTGLLLDRGRETLGTTVLDAEPDVILRMPKDSPAPLLLALALAAAFVGLLLHSWPVVVIATVGTMLAAVGWLWPEAQLGQTMEIVGG